ncbi:Transporter, MFS superfamily [Mycetohabitans rhizoxinica HKI 454]|uniref:Transporter, MFS superfamily n=1 Tax=Mycetohabitans rhizoxinica (strain DSM 19002 / CIP 109453 / HKI 454) TaxID=882378 RepID=E5AP36_MYCRK|nr:Transporter, MFS superfamily [Mycetohabitans rhizoxinica HKI 454]
MTSSRIRIFVVFSIGYFVSYVFRGVNLGFAPLLANEFGLSSSDLGTLTSMYFLGFAGAQIPVGVLLDRFGARRVTAAVMLVAAAGILLFGLAQDFGSMMLGRLLIGVGVSVCLGGAFQATAQHFPASQLTVVNGLVMVVGGLGGVVVGTPLTWLLSVTGWRTLCIALAVLTLVVAASIWVFGPHTREPQHRAGVLAQLQGTWEVVRSRRFWKLATFSGLTQSVFYAMAVAMDRCIPTRRHVPVVAGCRGPCRIERIGARCHFHCRQYWFWCTGPHTRALGRVGISILWRHDGVVRAGAGAYRRSRAVAADGGVGRLWRIGRQRHSYLCRACQALPGAPDWPREHEFHVSDFPWDLCAASGDWRGARSLAGAGRPLSGSRASVGLGRADCSARACCNWVLHAGSRRSGSARVATGGDRDG